MTKKPTPNPAANMFNFIPSCLVVLVIVSLFLVICSLQELDVRSCEPLQQQVQVLTGCHNVQLLINLCEMCQHVPLEGALKVLDLRGVLVTDEGLAVTVCVTVAVSVEMFVQVVLVDVLLLTPAPPVPPQRPLPDPALLPSPLESVPVDEAPHTVTDIQTAEEDRPLVVLLREGGGLGVTEPVCVELVQTHHVLAVDAEL